MRVVFDIDNTLYTLQERNKLDKYGNISKDTEIEHKPDSGLIQMAMWFYNNGDEVYAWSEAGKTYTNAILCELGLESYVDAIEKEPNQNIDVAFDDQPKSVMGYASLVIPVWRPRRYIPVSK